MEVKPERASASDSSGASDSTDAPVDDVGPVTRIVMDGVELEQSGPSQGTIPLLDDQQDHFIEVEFR